MASKPTVARRERAGVGALALVVMMLAACRDDDPAAPPESEARDANAADDADATDDADAGRDDAPSDGSPSREEATRGDTAGADDAPARRSLAQRIAPLLQPVPAPPDEIVPGLPSTGIVECDRYLANYMRCMATISPEGSMETFRDALRDTADAWARLGETPAAADAARNACRTAEETARKALTEMGCDWDAAATP